MISLHQQASDYIKAGAMNAVIGLHSFIDDQVFLTKTGDLGVVIHFPGIDFEGRELAELDTIARRFEAAVRTFTERAPRLSVPDQDGSAASAAQPAPERNRQ